MIIEILTLFPPMLESFLSNSILKRAQESGCVKIRIHNLRDYAQDKHKTVDDRPFGGGPGMLLKCEPLVRAIESIQELEEEKAWTVYLSPQGQVFKQQKAQQLSQYSRILFISGHYEGIDERVLQGGWIDEEISIGDYVLTNGTLPALVLTDAVVRLLPGVLGNEESPAQESFTQEDVLDCPHYTRPEQFQGMAVPPVLLSGNHQQVNRWRQEQARLKTQQKRADLTEAKN